MAAIVATYYGGDRDRIVEDAAFLKELLVTTVASNHPALPSEVSDEQCARARRFLSNFSHKFTLNYDLLLYWVEMRSDVDDLGLRADDGFRDPGYDADYVIWDDFHSPNIHYVHGALHLFDDGDELQKYTWVRTNIQLMEQIRSALSRDAFPLFVAEGSSREKLERINHSGYLHKAFRSFRSCTDSLFVFGHSFTSDEHIFSEISKRRSKYKVLYVSIYGDPASPTNKALMSKVESLAAKRPRDRPLSVDFFEANSARVWN